MLIACEAGAGLFIVQKFEDGHMLRRLVKRYRSSKPLFNQGNPFRILKSISVINSSPKSPISFDETL